MQDRITIPKRVEKAIGYSGWTALSWVLHNGWVQDYKWLFGQLEGRDVGTPETAEAFLYPWSSGSQRIKILERGALYLFQNRLEMKKMDAAKKLMIEGYLLGTDFVSPLWVKTNGKREQTGIIQDEHGANQLEGELRRYWANKNGIIQPREVELTRAVIDDYCAANELNNAADKFAKRLKL